MSFLFCCLRGGSEDGRRQNQQRLSSSSQLKQDDDKDRPLLQHEHFSSSSMNPHDDHTNHEHFHSTRAKYSSLSSSRYNSSQDVNRKEVPQNKNQDSIHVVDLKNNRDPNELHVHSSLLSNSATESYFLDDSAFDHHSHSYRHDDEGKESLVDQYESTPDFKIPMRTHADSDREEEEYFDDEHLMMIDHETTTTGVPPHMNKASNWTSQYNIGSNSEEDMFPSHGGDDDKELETEESSSPPEETFDESEYIDDDDEIFQQYYVSVVDNIDMTIVELECRNNRERDVKRMRIIKELKKTESNYLKTLETLQTYYLDPLKDGKNNIVSKDFFQKTVGELSIIYGINQLFYQKLAEMIDIPEEDDEKAMYEYLITKAYDMEVKLVNEIVKFSQALKLYTGFITKYKNSLDQLNTELERNKRLQRFIKEAFKSIQLAGLNPAPPSSYLIAPIQRIPRYQLLLNELTKNSAHYPELHEKYLQATESIAKVAEYCNEKEREVQNLARSFSISRKIRSRSIIQPSRKYLDECSFDFKKKSRKGSLTAYLFSDVLVITEKSMMQQKTKKLIFSKEMPISLEDVGENLVAILQGNNKYWSLIIDPTSAKQRQFISLLKQRCQQQ